MILQTIIFLDLRMILSFIFQHHCWVVWQIDWISVILEVMFHSFDVHKAFLYFFLWPSKILSIKWDRWYQRCSWRFMFPQLIVGFWLWSEWCTFLRLSRLPFSGQEILSFPLFKCMCRDCLSCCDKVEINFWLEMFFWRFDCPFTGWRYSL